MGWEPTARLVWSRIPAPSPCTERCEFLGNARRTSVWAPIIVGRVCNKGTQLPFYLVEWEYVSQISGSSFPQPPGFFLFGPRGTGKTTWLKQRFPQAIYLDLLDHALYLELLARPQRLRELIPPRHDGWVVLDEVQRTPLVLNEVHRLIEEAGRRFILTGSSARSLRRRGVNLLGGRARTLRLYPLTAVEAGDDFVLERALVHGQLPSVYTQPDPDPYLASYIENYLRQEVIEEGRTRNLAAFSRFLESASFSQASPLNVARVARDVGVDRNTAAAYFELLEDLLIASRVPVFGKRAKRRMTTHPKFYFFDAGVYRAIRPAGPLDSRRRSTAVRWKRWSTRNYVPPLLTGRSSWSCTSGARRRGRRWTSSLTVMTGCSPLR